MPGLKPNEISRAHTVEVSTLPSWLQRQIERDQIGPWCIDCGQPMPQRNRAEGYFTHPTCGPLELPDPAAAAGDHAPMTARERGKAAARRQKGTRD